MEVVAKLGRARFSSTIYAKKSLRDTRSVSGTFFEVPVFGSSATASMRRPCGLRRHVRTVTKSPRAVVTITTPPPPWCGCRLHRDDVTTKGPHPPRHAPHQCIEGAAAPSHTLHLCIVRAYGFMGDACVAPTMDCGGA